MTKLLVVLMLVSATANAEWILVAKGISDDGNVYIDTKHGIKKTKDGYYRVWVLWNFQQAQVSRNGQPYLSAKALEEYDCDEMRSRAVSITAYQERMGEGQVTGPSENGTGKWDYAPPDSIGDGAMTMICKLGK